MSNLRDLIIQRHALGITDPLEIPVEVLQAFEARVRDTTCDINTVVFTDEEVAAIIRRNTH